MPVNYDAFPLAGAPLGQPAQPIDARKMPWMQVLAHAVPNLPSDYIDYIINQAKGIAGRFPPMIGDVAQGKVPPLEPATMIMRGVQDATADPVGTAKRIAALPGAAAGYVRHAYTDPGALKNTVYNHPYQPVGDLSALLAGVGTGGEALAGDTGLIADLSRGAQVASTVLNPALAPARGAGMAATARAARVRGSAFNPDGSWTDQGLAAVRQAYPNVSQDVIDSPQFRASVAKVTGRKGVSAPAMREAMLDASGVQPTRSVVTRTKTAPGVQPAVDSATQSGLHTIARTGQTIGGEGEPNLSDVGAFVRQAEQAAKQAASQKFDAFRDTPGGFGTSLDPGVVNGAIADALKTHGFDSEAEFADEAGDYPQAQNAIQSLKSRLLNVPADRPITTSRIARLRSSLTNNLDEAKGSDINLTGNLVDAFHDILNQSADQFRGPDGQPNPTIGPAIREATDAWRDYKSTFGASRGAMSAVKTGVANAAANAKAAIDPKNTDLANGRKIADKLLHPTDGPQLYSGLTTIAGGPENMGPINDFIRAAATQVDPKTGVGPAWAPAKLRAFLNGEVAQNALTPDEIAQLRIASHAHDTLTSGRPQGQLAQSSGPIIPAILAGAAGTAGAMAGHALGLPSPVGEVIGGSLGTGLEVTADHALKASRLNREMSGAPTVGAKTQALGDFGNTIANVAPVLGLYNDKDSRDQVENAPDNSEPLPVPAGPVNYDEFPVVDEDHADGGRIGYATGGTVEPTVDELVDRLMKRSEQVKKAAKAQTKPLLNVPDNTVAKALSIAQGAMA